MACVLIGKDGKTIISATKWENMDSSPPLAEALAIRWSLKLALDLDLKNIMVFSDALTVVDFINKINGD